VEKSSSVYRILYKLEKNYKESIGILRISIPDSFSFSQSDMEEFFKKFGKIERIVLKQNAGKAQSEDQPRAKDPESLSYVIYSEYCSAILALKVLNSISEKERIFSAKICHSHPISSEAKLFCEPLIGSQRAEDMILEIERVLLPLVRTMSSENWRAATNLWAPSAWI
jgi:RNA recognition motif-containing protein